MPKATIITNQCHSNRFSGNPNNKLYIEQPLSLSAFKLFQISVTIQSTGLLLIYKAKSGIILV